MGAGRLVGPQAKGKHVVLRIFIDYPSKPSGLPAWLKNEVKLTRYEGPRRRPLA